MASINTTYTADMTECLLDLESFAEKDKGLVKLRKSAERGLTKGKGAFSKEFYSNQLSAIEAFIAAQNNN